MSSSAAAPDLDSLFARLPVGWSQAAYAGRSWGVTRTLAVGGRVEAVYAEELGGTGVVSANLYRTDAGAVLKPCEMPAEVVLAFLHGWQPTPESLGIA